jgi:EAL domain-containing protein (putative c-di-GMP-specific phosphodiesterase class I)
MYAAKADGKARIRTFEPSMHRHVLERLELTGELRRAMDMGEFELEYHPIVKLDTGAIAQASRWQLEFPEQPLQLSVNVSTRQCTSQISSMTCAAADRGRGVGAQVR